MKTVPWAATVAAVDHVPLLRVSQRDAHPQAGKVRGLCTQSSAGSGRRAHVGAGAPAAPESRTRLSITAHTHVAHGYPRQRGCAAASAKRGITVRLPRAPRTPRTPRGLPHRAQLPRGGDPAVCPPWAVCAREGSGWLAFRFDSPHRSPRFLRFLSAFMRGTPFVKLLPEVAGADVADQSLPGEEVRTCSVAPPRAFARRASIGISRVLRDVARCARVVGNDSHNARDGVVRGPNRPLSPSSSMRNARLATWPPLGRSRRACAFGGYLWLLSAPRCLGVSPRAATSELPAIMRDLEQSHATGSHPASARRRSRFGRRDRRPALLR